MQNIHDDDCIKEGISLDYVKTVYFHYHDPEYRSYCENCEKAGRERLIREALKNRKYFGFNELTDEEIARELDDYSYYDPSCEETVICDICGEILTGARYEDDGELFYSLWEAYADLIDSIYGKGTWEQNPFVWIYDFELTTE
jgi:hypothetical protein